MAFVSILSLVFLRPIFINTPTRLRNTTHPYLGHRALLAFPCLQHDTYSGAKMALWGRWDSASILEESSVGVIPREDNGKGALREKLGILRGFLGLAVHVSERMVGSLILTEGEARKQTRCRNDGELLRFLLCLIQDSIQTKLDTWPFAHLANTPLPKKRLPISTHICHHHILIPHTLDQDILIPS